MSQTKISQNAIHFLIARHPKNDNMIYPKNDNMISPKNDNMIWPKNDNNIEPKPNQKQLGMDRTAGNTCGAAMSDTQPGNPCVQKCVQKIDLISSKPKFQPPKGQNLPSGKPKFHPPKGPNLPPARPGPTAGMAAGSLWHLDK